MRCKIELNTYSDVQKFVDVVSRVPERVMLEDGNGYKVSAKSLLFTAVAKVEWTEIWVVSEVDITAKIFPWIV